MLPPGYTYVSSTTTRGTYVPSTGVWTIGILNNGASETFKVTAKVNPTGNYVNTASITGNELDSNLVNNNSSTETFPLHVADLSIVKTVDNPNPIVGQSVVFTIVATNNGPNDATGVIVTDILQNGYTYVSSTTTRGTYVPSTGVWTIGTLNNGASETFTITAKVNPTGNYVNTATITGNELDRNLVNNDSSTETFPLDVADLSIVKTVDNPNPIVGQSVVFTIVATNNGPNDATGVIVTDILQNGYTYVSSTTTRGTYVPSTGVWTIGTLNNGASETFTITAKVNPTGNYVNTASITGNELDSNLVNNVSSTETFPLVVADLSIIN